MASRHKLWLASAIVCLLFGHIRTQDMITGQNQIVCRGTSNGLVSKDSAKFMYSQLKTMYTNCTHVLENLEIVFLEGDPKDFDMSFLESIEEVFGYVLIVGNVVDYIPMTRLQIIRGKTLYEHENKHYSLFVALNFQIGSRDKGLRELRFTSLTEILNGKVYFNNNNLLCFENTIDWADINPRENPPVEYYFNSKEYRRPCGECDPSCYQVTTKERHCWGEGKAMCQKLTQGDVCHGSCEGRCYGKLPNQCCHPECAGGCTGPKKTDCYACRNFYDEGACVNVCPRFRIYDSKQMKVVKNPNAKYMYGSLCVNDCPKFLVKDEGACVRECSENKAVNNSQECKPCNGPCPRTCKGLFPPHFINSANINSFADCTIIKGPIRILAHTFIGDEHNNIEPLHPSNLTVLKNIQEITHYLQIQSQSDDLTDLSFLSNLKVIQGIELSKGNAISIISTKLRSLKLMSLEKINNGKVLIFANSNLCFAETVNWQKMFAAPNQVAHVMNNKPIVKCNQEGYTCHDQCQNNECWGLGPEMCISCANMVYITAENQTCLSSCSERPMLYHAGSNVCKKCHPQCNNTCSGPDNTHCDSCAGVTLLDQNNTFTCYESCPDDTYPDERQICQPCHKNCDEGCTGPSKIVGPGGCNSCEVGIRSAEDPNVIHCLPKNTDACQDGYYLKTQSFQIQEPIAGKRLCELCDPLCLTCIGPGVPYCRECRYFKYDSVCSKECPPLNYGDTRTKLCIQCDSECRGGCNGSSAADCVSCVNYKVYLDDTYTKFNCTEVCPPGLEYIVSDETSDDHIVCVDETHPKAQLLIEEKQETYKRKIALIVGPVVAGTVLLALLLTLFGYFLRKRAKANEKTAALTARMTGFEETEPLTPTNAKPDLAQIRLIKESELRRGGIIGSGAFGTVYKGFWIPQGEQVKIPVAIKVLQEGMGPSQNKELLEEARVMVSVEHVCCIRILAVCMTAQMMLITQLMPLGCLLDYVRKNKDHIGSKVLLNWCTQIARGMAYLEERGIVHRDLAARNVLVQTPKQIKITDFGLAKLLDYNEDEYHAAGGKMPIKWLALECIQHRTFTHKSDVWSFGVTVWELFTYGQKPYDNIRARDVPDLLEKGERLPQPHICTIDVYMIMIKCWMLDAESRPSFKELAEEFAKMARDPGRYLVIPGDKLMRLPSHTYDKQDLVRSVSVAADGPEEVMEADDYLQPQSVRTPSVENNNSPLSMSPLMLPEGASNMDAKPFGKEPPRARREKRYAHLDAAAEARQQRQMGHPRGREDSCTRYSSDPVKFFRDRDDIHLSPAMDAYPIHTPNGLPHSPSSPVPKPEAPLRLPLDEDNYLQPKAANPAPYMDLNDKVYYENERVFDDPGEDGDPYFTKPPPATHAVANPEYFDQSDDDLWTRSEPNGLLKPHKLDGRIYYNDLSPNHSEIKPLMREASRSESRV